MIKPTEVIVNVINKSNNPLPIYATIGAACADIYAAEDYVIYPWERRLLKTGLKVEVPYGYEIEIRPRSGLALNQGITVVNSPGTIDADYRGEIGVILINHGNGPYAIKKGDRIAQMALKEVIQIQWNPVLMLPGTDRGSGGFNSTGTK